MIVELLSTKPAKPQAEPGNTEGTRRQPGFENEDPFEVMRRKMEEMRRLMEEIEEKED